MAAADGEPLNQGALALRKSLDRHLTLELRIAAGVRRAIETLCQASHNTRANPSEESDVDSLEAEAVRLNCRACFLFQAGIPGAFDARLLHGEGRAIPGWGCRGSSASRSAGPRC